MVIEVTIHREGDELPVTAYNTRNRELPDSFAEEAADRIGDLLDEMLDEVRI